MNVKFWLPIFLIITCTNVFAQDKKKELDNFFSALSQNQQFNGNVLIAENGRIIYEKAFGYADFSSKKPSSTNASFPIASITKTITSTAVLQLIEKGKLKLDDYVFTFLPEFPYHDITIKQLLSHTSGLPVYDTLFFPQLPDNPNAVFENKDIIPSCISQKTALIFKPGEDFSYNNVNYNILALIVEKISGMSFQSYLKKNIFEPAGMTNTSTSKFLNRPDKNLPKRYNLQHLYSDQFQMTDTVSEFKPMYNFNFQGHGDLISTTHDLLQYDIALYNGSLLKDSSLKEAFTPVKLSNGKDNIQRYALGWITREDTSMGEIVKHDGGMPGGRSMLLRNITKHQTIILFDNTSNNVIPIADNALRILNNVKIEKPKKSGSKIYGITLANQGTAAADQILKKIKKEISNYYLDENEMNSLGYEFTFSNKNTEAEIVFKKNTELFPLSWNTYDSYGEILLKNHKKTAALKMYKKSIELNPENENGKNVLKQFQG